MTAETIYAVAGMGATFKGSAGVLIPLGIELVVNDLAMVTKLYNYWALLTITVLATMASQFDNKYMQVLIPLWAGFCMFAGWLKYDNMGTGFGILVVCAGLAIMNYMVETRHQRFGIAGPGNMIVKIFTFLIVLQCVVVFINAAQIFPGEIPALAESNSQYANIDLASDIGHLSDTGGLTAFIMNVSTITLQIAVSALMVIIKCLISIGAFALILAQVFPWIAQAGAAGAAFLILLQIAIWTMYAIFLFTIFYRPSGDPGW